MKDAKLKIIFASLIALISVNSQQPVLATETVKATPIEKGVDELLIVKDDLSLSPEEKLSKETTAREKILKEALASSLEEVGNIKTKLTKLPDFGKDSKEEQLKEKFVEELGNYEIYYKEQNVKLDSLIANSKGDETLNEDLKQSIIELKNYREEIYNPRFQKMVEFLLLFYSDDVLQITQNRFDKISNDVSKLEKLGFIKSGSLKPSLEKAIGLISDAQALQVKAKSLIIDSNIPSEETIDNKPAATEDPSLQPAPRELIETSLGKIKSAYDIFLQISKDIRKTLGI